MPKGSPLRVLTPKRGNSGVAVSKETRSPNLPASMALMIAPPEIPPELEAWRDVVLLLLDNGNIPLKKFRLEKYTSAVDAGRARFPGARAMTSAQFDAILDFVRPHTDWALRPRKISAPPLAILDLPEEEEAASTSLLPFEWKWLDIPTPWTDKNGVFFHTFPLPVALLRGDALEGQKHVLSLTALWRLWEGHIDPHPHSFVQEGQAKRWAVWTALGIKRQEVCKSLSSQAAYRRHYGVPPPAQPYQFKMCMATMQMLMGCMVWFARNSSQGEAFQKTTFAFVEFLCSLLPNDLTLMWQGAAVPIVGRALNGLHLQGLLASVGILSYYTTGKVFTPPEINQSTVPVALVWLVWTVFRHSGKTDAAFALCKTLVTMLSTTLDAALGSVLHTTFPTCRLCFGCPFETFKFCLRPLVTGRAQ